jgi:hypothetical protein
MNINWFAYAEPLAIRLALINLWRKLEKINPPMSVCGGFRMLRDIITRTLISIALTARIISRGGG